MKNKPEVKKIDRRSKEYRNSLKKLPTIQQLRKSAVIPTEAPVGSSSISDQIKELSAAVLCLNDLSDRLLSRISQLENKVG